MTGSWRTFPTPQRMAPGKVTCGPGTGLPSASVTNATNGLEKLSPWVRTGSSPDTVWIERRAGDDVEAVRSRGP